MGQPVAQIVAEARLDRPDIGGLPHEGGAVGVAQHRIPVVVLPPEGVEDGPVAIQDQELPHRLHRQHLAIGQGGRWPPVAHSSPCRVGPHLGQHLIDQAVDG
jgi:hypothetical protein